MLRHVHCSERYSRRLERRLYASALRAGCRCAEFISPAGSESSSDISPAVSSVSPWGQKVRTVNYVMLTEYCSDNSRSAPAVKLRISPSAAYNDRKGILPKNVDNFFEKMGVKKRLAMQTAQKTYTRFMRNQPEIREGRRSLCLPSLSAEKRNRLRLSMARKRLSRPLTGAACFAIFRHE